MLKGEGYLYGSWYYFDPNTGAMAHDFVYLRQADKWVYYDKYTGKMQYGEHCVNGGWYYMNTTTGALAKGWTNLKNKRVYYDSTSSRMVHGGAIINGKHYFLDPYTGAQYSKQQIVDRLISSARSQIGKHPDCPGALAANGGLICPYGPCMSLFGIPSILRTWISSSAMAQRADDRITITTGMPAVAGLIFRLSQAMLCSGNSAAGQKVLAPATPESFLRSPTEGFASWMLPTEASLSVMPTTTSSAMPTHITIASFRVISKKAFCTAVQNAFFKGNHPLPVPVSK